MSLELFESHIHLPKPAFRCFDCLDREEIPSLLVPLTHRIPPPASELALKQLKSLPNGIGNHLEEFYKLHDGLLLYEQETSGFAGLLFYPILEWDAMRARLREDYEYLDVGDFEDPNCPFSGIPIGEPCHSGNYFLLQQNSPNSGKIFYTDHELGASEPFAHSFAELLIRIASDPAQFLLDAGCYARYFDGTTDRQWVPKKFVSAESA